MKPADGGSTQEPRRSEAIYKDIKKNIIIIIILLFARDDEVAAMREDELRILTEKKNEGYIRPHKLRIKKIDREKKLKMLN